MSLCLSHPAHGYYTTRNPFGQTGDFITSPDISQMFGELIGHRINVNDVANLTRLSRRQLERRFRKTFQTSPRSYLIRMRILAACDLLENAEQSVTEVALEVGFYDHSDFSRQFRRIIGQSPTDYRRQKAGQMEMPLE